MVVDELVQLPKPMAYILPGGGALGAYQAGVLQALHEAGLRPDLLVGVSAGALNAALYAWAPTSDGLAAMADIWAGLRRRDLLRINPGRLALALGGQRPSLLDNRRSERVVRRYFGHRLLEHSPVPLIVVATDLTTGRPVGLTRGDTALAIVASCAFPGVMPPVEIDGRTLIDGGVVADIPLELAMEHGARSAIIVPVPPLADRHLPRHPLGVLMRSSTWGVEAHGRTQLRRPPQGLVVVEVPAETTRLMTFDVGRHHALVDEAQRTTAAWLAGDRHLGTEQDSL